MAGGTGRYACNRKAESHTSSIFLDGGAECDELFASSRRKFGELLLVADCEIPKPLDSASFIHLNQ